MKAAQLIETLGLKPHPEGGHYKEVFRAARTVSSKDRLDERNASTAIYFLLEAGEFSALHRVSSDEAWHHYDGCPLELVWLSEAGAVRRIILGPDIQAGQRPLAVVPENCWQAARPTGGSADYCLVGCTVSPGFEFADFELPTRASLLELLPAQTEFVLEFTRDS